ncbi:hypothetical protein PMAYCL1PPCAC_07180, partial [Pristionchus mayeri]
VPPVLPLYPSLPVLPILPVLPDHWKEYWLTRCSFHSSSTVRRDTRCIYTYPLLRILPRGLSRENCPGIGGEPMGNMKEIVIWRETW